MVQQQGETIEALESQVADLADVEASVNEMDEDMPTEPVYTTAAPTKTPTTAEPTLAPTADWSYRRVESMDGAVCNDGNGRLLKSTGVQREGACGDRCSGNHACMYFVYNPDNNVCILCDREPTDVNEHTTAYDTYEMRVRDRRRLSELELLRAENAALREAIAQLRRN